MRRWIGAACFVPLAFVVAYACGGGGDDNSDAGASDASTDRAPDGPGAICDFPCSNPWVCVQGGWQSGQTIQCTSGAYCVGDGAITPCPEGYACNKEFHSSQPACVLACPPFPAAAPSPFKFVAAEMACSTQQIDAYVGACGTKGSALACAQWQADAGACKTCVARAYTNMDPTKLNIASCIGITEGDAAAGSCAVRHWQATTCEMSACEAPCDAGDLEHCRDAAAMGPCSSWEKRCTFAEGGVEEPCFATALDDQLRNYAGIFCNP